MYTTNLEQFEHSYLKMCWLYGVCVCVVCVHMGLSDLITSVPHMIRHPKSFFSYIEMVC